MNKNGFTIIELIVSIFILSIAVVGIFSAFSMMVILTSDASDRLVATYLSQEAMEVVRNIRDYNWLKMDADEYNNGYSWVDGLVVGVDHGPMDCSSATGKGCKTTYAESYQMFQMDDNDNDYLRISTTGFYSYSGIQTKFKRKIIINPVSDASGIYMLDVVVQTCWDRKASILNRYRGAFDGGYDGANCVQAEQTLYNWYNYEPPPAE